MTILIVDDEPVVAEVIKRLLQDLKADFHVAYSWTQAEDLIRKLDSLELVTLDLILPDTTSPEETLSKINLIKTIHPNVIVAVVTGLNDFKLPPDCHADLFLPKTSMAQKLLSTIRDAFGKDNAGYKRNIECLEQLTQRTK